VGIVALIIVLAGFFGAWWVRHNIYASEFTPTRLRVKEQGVLNSKVETLRNAALKEASVAKDGTRTSETPLTPEPYTEEGANRTISFSEKELNSLIANDPELARRVAIDLSDDLVSLKLVMPMDAEVPVVGGKTLRLSMGLVVSHEAGKLLIALKGVSLGGIPLPNAWLGYMKNRNLVNEFGSEEGFWKLFAEGVKDIRIREGQLRIQLKE
jgi:hypothetical protein